MGVPAASPTEPAPSVVCVGVLIVDVLAAPVATLPPPERAHLLDEVRVTAAGTAAATAVDLARLGCRVFVEGAVGDDAFGDLLLRLLRQSGADVRAVTRLPGVLTSSSILPVSADGERFTWHLRGANAMFAPEHLDRDLLQTADAVHVGGPDVLSAFGPADFSQLFADARAAGAITSLDLLSNLPSIPSRWMQQWLPAVDIIAVNTHQALIVTGAEDALGAAHVLHGWGADWAAVTCGAKGCVVVTSDGAFEAPGFPVPVVDTTGCGDAFSAGLIRSRLDGRDAVAAAQFANAAAALVATGLGSDAGLVDEQQVHDFAHNTATIGG